MPTGTVKFFLPTKGYGLLLVEGVEGDVFVHRSAIVGEGYRCLEQGERVELEVVYDSLRERNAASNVRPLTGRKRGQVSHFNHQKGFGFIRPDDGGDSQVFFHFSDILMHGTKTAVEGDVVEFDEEPGDRGPVAKQVKRLDCRLPLFRFANLGPEERWLDALAARAEQEDWIGHRNRSNSAEPSRKGVGGPILKSYVTYTFARLEEEGKIALGGSEGRNYSCFNTGLVTPNQEPLYALFDEKDPRDDGCSWRLDGFYAESDRQLLGKFARLPELANYFDDPTVLLYDRRCDLYIDVDHIVNERIDRFPSSARDNPYLARQLLESARRQTEQRVYRNYKTAIPQFHRGSVQLLLPLCLLQPDKADLALTVSRYENQYRGDTVLTLDMAYNNARLLTRPDSEWLHP